MNLELRIKNYINRYAPSEKKLREYISKKKYTFPTLEFLSTIGYDESMMCELWISTFLRQGKTEFLIRQKLIKKGFQTSIIQFLLEKQSEAFSDWGNYRETVERLIASYVSRRKSKLHIYSVLTSRYPHFRDEIRTLCEEIEETDSLSREFEQLIQRYDITDRKQKEKLIATLLRKGFRYEDIKHSLEAKSR